MWSRPGEALERREEISVLIDALCLQSDGNLGRVASLSVVALIESAGDGGPRLQLARDGKEVQHRDVMLTKEVVPLSAVQEAFFAGGPK